MNDQTWKSPVKKDKKLNPMHLHIWRHKFEENHKFVAVYYFVEVKS